MCRRIFLDALSFPQLSILMRLILVLHVCFKRARCGLKVGFLSIMILKIFADVTSGMG